MLIETHAHLDYPDFANDLDNVLGRATEAGVTRVITIGTSVESSRRAINLAEKHPNIYAVIGVHPTYAEEAEEDVITPLRKLANSRRVVGIGETGLDYHHLPSVEAAKEKNVQVFARAFQGETEEEIEANIQDGPYTLRHKFRFGSLWWKQIALISRPFHSVENAASPHIPASWLKRSRLHAAFRWKKLARPQPKPQKDFSDSTDEDRYLQPRNPSRRR